MVDALDAEHVEGVADERGGALLAGGAPAFAARGVAPDPPPRPLDFTGEGPLAVVRMPNLRQTLPALFPRVEVNQTELEVHVTLPKAAEANPDLREGFRPPFPLAVISSGFLVDSESYQSYADKLASWGWVVITYDKAGETMNAPINDDVSAIFVSELIDWATRLPRLAPLVDTVDKGVFLVGHSRGGKVSMLAAARDPRVTAAVLIDPVDNTKYAPLGEGFPSAIAAMGSEIRETLPVAIVGAQKGGDCAPREANYKKFFEAVPRFAWEVEVEDAGHFQFLDSMSFVQSSVCAIGKTDDRTVRNVAQAVMVSWGEATVKRCSGLGREMKAPVVAPLTLAVANTQNLLAYKMQKKAALQFRSRGLSEAAEG